MHITDTDIWNFIYNVLGIIGILVILIIVVPYKDKQEEN